jgi:hypothetical protein
MTEINTNRDGRDISIDKYKLDDEFITQPDLMLYFSDLLSRKNKEVNDLDILIDQSKDQLKALKANIELDYRRGIRKIGDVKLTESTIEAAVNSDEKVEKLQNKQYELRQKYNSLLEERDKLAGIVDAVRHRKSSLENLATLYVAGYYSQPTAKDRTNSIRLSQRSGLNKREEINE